MIALAVDVGGTNTSCALTSIGAAGYEKLFFRRYATHSEPSLIAVLEQFLRETTAEKLPRPEAVCVCAAGPLSGRKIILTNAPWSIDGEEIESKFSIQCLVINDFSAVAWGVLYLRSVNSPKLFELPREGARPVPNAASPVVIAGAGTGLGFAFALQTERGAAVYPSEGGHTGIPVYDEDSRLFSLWLQKKYACENRAAAGAEAGVSGQGIVNIYTFFAEHAGDAQHILEAPPAARAGLVSQAAAEGDALCLRTMDFFIHLYARVAADAASVFLPFGGLYLAGGIAAKNIRFFTDNNRFMSYFSHAYRSHIRGILDKTPVAVVMDYDVSLYGAAYAAAVHVEQV